MSLTLVNDPASCSLVVRALASPALDNGPLFLLLTARALGGPAFVHAPTFSVFCRQSYTRFSDSPRNKTDVVLIPWFLPGWYTIDTSRCFSDGAILRCVSVVRHCTSPFRRVLGVYVPLRMFRLYFVCSLPTIAALR